MRGWYTLGLLGPLCGCFVDPGSATVGASAAGSTGVVGTTSGTTEVGVATGSSGGAPEPTSSGTGAGGGTTTTGATTGPVDATSGSEGATTIGGESSSGGSASTGGIEVPVPGCQVLYFNDFSQDPADELELIGKWKWDEQAGTVRVETVADESSMAITKELWKDALVYTRVRVTSGYAVVRMRSEKQLFEWSNYFGSIQPWADKAQIGRTISGNGDVFQSPNFASDFGVWYTLTLAVVGNQLSFGVDDKIVASSQDGMLTAGQASIGGFGAGVAEFDWFLVCLAD